MRSRFKGGPATSGSEISRSTDLSFLLPLIGVDVSGRVSDMSIGVSEVSQLCISWGTYHCRGLGFAPCLQEMRLELHLIIIMSLSRQPRRFHIPLANNSSNDSSFLLFKLRSAKAALLTSGASPSGSASVFSSFKSVPWKKP